MRLNEKKKGAQIKNGEKKKNMNEQWLLAVICIARNIANYSL